MNDVKSSSSSDTNKERKAKKKRKHSSRTSDTPSSSIKKSDHGNKKRKKRKKSGGHNKHRPNVTKTNQKKSKKKKQKSRWIIAILAILLILLLLLTIFYQITHVKMPDFVNKSMTDVTRWADTNRLNVETENSYSLKVEKNHVIKQESTANKMIRKGSHLTFVVSQGADPDEHITLPDFSDMTENQVEEFIEKNKAENIHIINDYSGKGEPDKFSKVEFSDKDVTADNYRRKDNLDVYFSKNAETTNKNISVPDFTNKTKNDIEDWAKKNKISVTYEEVFSDTIKPGNVVSQSTKENEKLAKNDKMTVFLSGEKTVDIPNFADYTPETSVNAVEGITPNIKQVFSDTVAAGQLISQSSEPGEKLTGEEAKKIEVIYSYGKPYVKSYVGQQGSDISKIIEEDFNSKGANVTYDTYEVDSDQPKGSIIKMSLSNQYMPLDSHISFGISSGHGQSNSNEGTKSSRVERKGKG